jgi:hypothetical protein
MASIVWDMRQGGDWRLRAQGYASGGMGLVKRHKRSAAFWAPHLEKNHKNILEIADRLEPKRGGTMLVLGAGRLLDIPWEDLFPRFERVVLVDADYTIVPFAEQLIANSKTPNLPKPVFEIGDAAGSVVETAAFAEKTIREASDARAAAKELARGFAEATLPTPAWARKYPDARLVVSANLLSQLAHFPRVYVQGEFRKRFERSMEEGKEAFVALEDYLRRVQTQHVHCLASLTSAWVYLSADVRVFTYDLPADQKRALLEEPVPEEAGFGMNEEGDLLCHWDASIQGQSEPLGGQQIPQMWPPGTPVEGPRRWIWHIVPQGAEQGLQFGRIHVVEAWTKKG